MKRIISLLLMVITLSSLLVGCGQNTLNDKTRIRIIDDFLRSSALDAELTSNDVEYTYLGQYGSGHAIYFYTSGAYKEPLMENIASYYFYYQDSRAIKIWFNGKLYTLSDAYDLKLINKSNVESIWKKSFTLEYKEPYFYFEDKIKSDIPPIFFVKPDRFYWNMFIVELDKRISRVDSIPDLSFFDCKNIEEIKDITPISDKDKGNGNFNQTILLILNFETPEEAANTHRRIKSIDGVKEVVFNQDMLDGLANDNYYVDNSLWGLDEIKIEKVWDFTTGSKDIFVGVIDYGIKLHEDLVGNLVVGYDFVNENNITSDDPNNHGTYVAGVLGGVGNNQQGITGVNWNLSMVPLQVFNDWLASSSYIANAVDYATSTYSSSNPIKLINLSMSSDYYFYSIERAISEYPGLLICAAGNEGENTDVWFRYPGFHGADLQRNPNVLENIIVVGAIDINDNRGILDNGLTSNYGEKSVDIYAPGINIYTTSNTSEYTNVSATSYATPYVTGVAALLLSINPNLTAGQIKECIINGADTITITVGDGTTQDVKKLNAWGAFTYLMNNYYTYNTQNITIGNNHTVDTVTDSTKFSYFDENTSFIKLNVQETGDYKFDIVSSALIKTSLYNSNFELIGEELISNSNACIEFEDYLIKGIYYLKTNLTIDTTVAQNISIVISGSEHIHDYTMWKKHSSTHHIESCECGALGTQTNNHVVRAGTAINNRGICMFCGAVILLGEEFVPALPFAAVQVTLNGSYILPNGIIVLVDEDIEAYLNGTLVFYDKDDLPVTQ